jgi:hypothetical protein
MFNFRRLSRRARRSTIGAMLMLTGLTGTTSAQTFDHGAFDALLKAHVADGMVNYDAFRAAPTFKSYLAALARQDPKMLPRAEQLAFWINAYNAYTIQLIISHNETRSIRNINKTLGLKLKGPWSEKMAAVGGTTYTLDNIEHDIIRPTYNEPRIHFALVCAAMGCPPLRSEAYTGARLETQLDEQARMFLLESPEKNRVDVASRTFYHSMIFGYYKADFGGSLESAGAYAARWFPAGSPERRLLESGKFRAVETEYDWTLNSQQQARARRGAVQ